MAEQTIPFTTGTPRPDIDDLIYSCPDGPIVSER